MRVSAIPSSLFLLLTLSISVNSDEVSSFGRLFTSPEQRVTLNGMREQIALDANFVNQKIAETVDATSTKTSPGKTQDIQLSGYILREDGTAMIWINGRSELSGLDSRELKTSTPRANQSQITVRVDGQARSLKPGQVWSPTSNHVQESYLNAPKAILKVEPESGSDNIDTSDEVPKAPE